MTAHSKAPKGGFPAGLTSVATKETNDGFGIDFAVLKLKAGETFEETTACESAYLLMAGEAEFRFANRAEAASRASLFDVGPTCLHVGKGERVALVAKTDAEFTLYRCANAKSLQARYFRPSDVPDEYRGKGQVGDQCLRNVRTIFDAANSPKDAELVLGEVVTLPGRWSSYPPHHHPQPEIYHYRFTEKQGYGHAELGETVLKVRDGDTVKIADGQDHAQAAAPGYGMYYAWVIRHLPNNPYGVPEFTEEHRWTMAKDAKFWRPEWSR